MKRYLAVAVTTVFFLIFMTVMVFFLLYRDTSSEREMLTSGDNPDGSLLFTENAEEIIEEEEPVPGREDYFCIPIPEGTKASDISIDDSPLDGMTLVSIPIKEESYYYKHNLSGTRKGIREIGFSILDGKVIFEIHTDGVRVLSSESDDRFLYVRYDSPREIYDRIILIDPGHGGADTGSEAYGVCEKDIALGIAGRIEDFGEDRTGIFFTRTDDSSVPASDREEYVNKLDPDLLITLHTNADGSTRITRGVEVYYNKDELKEPAEKLAEDLLRISGTSGKKVMKEKKIPGFEGTDVPVIMIKTGYITNRSEAWLMAGEEYEEKAARAIEEMF
ncbi:MAG: N-acetylmuramoyl-L-alanine amidase [Lachnospiraceae bacterium]|nr:N-acetylmuramoyl-L-alanine amidase [Lachnospiraceae bacterium]